MNYDPVQVERLIDIRRYDEARRILGEAIAHHPNDPHPHTQLAKIAIEQDDFDAARTHVEQALATDPNFRFAQFLLFRILEEQRQYAEAERVIIGLIRTAPTDSDYLSGYARLMMFTGNLKKARSLTNESLRHDPDHRYARIVDVILACVERRRDRAESQITDLVRKEPDSIAVIYTLYGVLIDQHRYDEAFALGRDLVQLDPTNDDLIESVVQMRKLNHWLGWPLRPILRGGWGGAGLIWVAAIVGISLLSKVNAKAGAIAAACYVVYVIYSWIYGPIMDRWLRHRGVG